MSQERIFGMGTSIKILRNRTLKEGYVSATAFEQTPRKLFVCVWPADPHVQERMALTVRALSQSDENAPDYERYALVAESAGAPAKARRYILKFYKTAQAFDLESFGPAGERKFFWQGGKGSRFQITTDEVAAADIIFRAAPHRNNNIIFCNMLAAIGREAQKNACPLTGYLEENFDVSGKRTYSFEVYLQVPLALDQIRFGESVEDIYRFSREAVPGKNFPVVSILYEYTRDAVPIKRRHFHENMAGPHSGESRAEEVLLDVKQIMSECISDFFGAGKFKHRKIIDDRDRELLTVAIIERLRASLDV